MYRGDHLELRQLLNFGTHEDSSLTTRTPGVYRGEQRDLKPLLNFGAHEDSSLDTRTPGLTTYV